MKNLLTAIVIALAFAFATPIFNASAATNEGTGPELAVDNAVNNNVPAPASNSSMQQNAMPAHSASGSMHHSTGTHHSMHHHTTSSSTTTHHTTHHSHHHTTSSKKSATGNATSTEAPAGQ